MTGLLEALNLAGYAPGERPPEFTGRTAEGGTLTSAGVQGRVILLTFWATWCPPCRGEMPVFEQLHRDFAPHGLTVLGVNVREEEPAIQRYARELGLTFPLLMDRKGEIQISYGVIAFSTTFLIGRDGRAVARAIGPRDWGTPEARALIRALLAEPSPSR
jgi:peroxiredoxin